MMCNCVNWLFRGIHGVHLEFVMVLCSADTYVLQQNEVKAGNADEHQVKVIVDSSIHVHHWGSTTIYISAFDHMIEQTFAR